MGMKEGGAAALPSFARIVKECLKRVSSCLHLIQQ